MVGKIIFKKIKFQNINSKKFNKYIQSFASVELEENEKKITSFLQ